MTWTVAIPDWTAAGVLPPIGADPTAPDRSPYTVSLLDVINRFGTTAERRAILAGFLRYREALHEVGMVVGQQWLDGSFAEDVEAQEGRAPNDLDVVTFHDLDGPAQLRAFGVNPSLLARGWVKANCQVDGFLVSLRLPADRVVERATYWYSMWSHRRDLTWKGYLAIDLAPTEDADALAQLNVTEVAP